MSKFVYVGWVGDQSSVYVDIFPKNPCIKIFIREIKDMDCCILSTLSYPSQNFAEKKYFKNFSEAKQLFLDFVLTRRQKCQNISKAMSCRYDKV